MIRVEEMERLFELSKNDSYFNKLGTSFVNSYREDENTCGYSSHLICKYGGRFSKNLNESLRKSNLYGVTDFIKLYEYLLRKALKELLIYERNAILYRMDEPGIEFDTIKHWYKKRIGETVSFPNFLSTSQNRWNRSETDVIFKIITGASSSARDVSHLTGKPLEKEVLFMSRSKFRITSVDEKNRHIDLEEVRRDVAECIMIYNNTYKSDYEIQRLLGSEEDDSEKDCLSLTDQGLI